MNRGLKRVLSAVLILVMLLTGLPDMTDTYAAGALSLSVAYNTGTKKYDISFPMAANPGKVIVNYHGPDYETGDPTAFQINHTYADGTVTVSMDLMPDHIYDFTVDVYTNYDDLTPSYQGKIYYLADMTFTGESFNIMAKNFDIEDQYPDLETDVNGNVVTVHSGNDPKMRLVWKVPTLYYWDGAAGSIIYLTDNRALGVLQKIGIPVSKACFQVVMKVGHGSTKSLEFNTDYSGGNMVIVGQTATVTGFSGGSVTDPDGSLSVTLDQNNGIEPGTEYELTNIGIIFKNASSVQVPLRQTNLNTGDDNHFLVENIDHAFDHYTTGLTSIFTPIQMELTKVDTDKVEVRFKKIVNGVYPELFYQIQYAPRIDDLFSQSNSWVKIPDNSIPANQDYGSEIVTINMSGTTHPEYYFRVVYYDSSSALPRSSSLCVDLRLLDTNTGKPPLPREIKAETVYAGRQDVTVPTTDLSSGTVEIPASDLRLSFEKPIAWKQAADWNAFKAASYTASDFTFHILLSTYLPGSSIDARTKTIGLSQTKEIYLPVKQKRVLVLGKKDFTEDPNDPNRVICIIPGDRLFYDYVDSTSLAVENNEDPSGEGAKSDYPTFLVPNTTYYMQVFTSRYEDNAQITADVWGDSGGLTTPGLGDKLSYTSPFISFTTWPLNEIPVPMPGIQLGIDPETNVDPATGNITLNGISVKYNRVLTDTDWDRYTLIENGREIQYEIYISRSPSVFSSTPVKIDAAPYPAQADVLERGVILDKDDTNKPIMPNTVYYLKARTSLIVGGVVIGRSDFTAVKAITTPKIDSGGLDNVSRDPRAPSEFSIAVDEDGAPLLSDAWVTLNWLHAEDDVTYEMICTENSIDSDAAEAEYAADPVNVNFLSAYNSAGHELFIDVENASGPLATIDKLQLDANGHVVLPIRRDFLRPNRTYFFSLRAVRNRNVTDSQGNSLETVSRWITVPVTTKMVQAPGFLEAVRDLEIGFHIQCPTNGATADTMEVYLKKKEAADDKYVRLNRSQYTCVRDGTDFYFRIYNLVADQWYDIRVRDSIGNRWYNGSNSSWGSAANPIQAKTRDTMGEIEVRWEGEDPYRYFLEARTDQDADYETLSYSSSGFTDHGYDLANGGRIEFYREKTNLYVQENSPKYIYYALIKGKPVRTQDGTVKDLPLKSNTDYYIKLWAYNLEESLHIGPVSVRTDFSQKDYDEEQKEDNVIDLFNNEADKLSRKLYWLLDFKTGTTVRAILKDDKVSGLLQAGGNSTVTVDLSGEQENASYYEILIPYKTLEAVEKYDSRLNLKLSGSEITLNRGSIDLEALKAQALTGGAKEAMLLLRVSRATKPKTAIPSGFTAASDFTGLQAVAIGSRMTYTEINKIIYNILKEPDATGPFKYGILDRELSKVLTNLDSYSYRSHTDLSDLIKGVISNVEIELSRYIKDLIDGGSGYQPDFAVSKGITSFPGKIGIKLDYTFQNGYITPYVNYGSGWQEPSGAKGYVLQVVLFRAEKPGEFAILTRGTVIAPGDTAYDALTRLSSRYDLTKVFGKGTIYPANPIKGEQAVMLYAVLTGQDSEMAGLMPVQRTSRLGIRDIIGTTQLTGYMDNQSSLSLAVELYCSRSNVDPALMTPSSVILITNGSQIDSRLYRHVTLGLDLKLAELDNGRFDATGRTTIGRLLDMMEKALEKIG